VSKQTFRWVAYFPTPAFSKIASLFDHPVIKKNEVEIIALRAARTAREEPTPHVSNPLPYLKIETPSLKSAFVEYTYRKHGKLRLNGLRKALIDNQIPELAVSQLAVKLKKEWVLGKRAAREDLGKYHSSWERNPWVAAIFKLVFPREGGERREEAERHLTEEEKSLRFKRSTLELYRLQDTRVYLSGGNETIASCYDDEVLLWAVMSAIDYEIALAKYAQYKMGAADQWVLVRTGSIKELMR
jgi:hypothetical protein